MTAINQPTRDRPVIGVFTKNRTNPAYTAARVGAERTAARCGAQVVHYVPDKPDDIEEQVALVDRAIAERPDAVVFVPVHDTAMKIGCIATEAALRHLRGERVPREILLPVQIVDASNYAAWDMPFEQRQCPDWDDVVKDG